MTFTKLFTSITESTIWTEPDPVRLVWITMLAMADRKGRIWASVPGLANRARVDVDKCEDAIGRFLKPDKYSRTPDHEGRRIEPIDGGWRLLNYEKYRSIRDEETVKESKRKYINSRRKKEKNVENVDQCRSQSNAVDHSRSLSIQAEAEAEAIHTPAEGERFAEEFKKLLPPDTKLPNNWKFNWARTYGELTSIDKRSKKEIWDVCVWARNDSFWSGQFMSACKLRKINSDGIHYFDVFKAKMDAEAKPKNGHTVPKIKTAAQWRAEQQAMDAERERNATQP